MAESSLAETLAQTRIALDLSQEELADAAGVSVDTVARIEQGKRKQSRPDTLRKLAGALGVSVEGLLGLAVERHSSDVDVAPLRRAINADSSIPGLDDDLVDTREVLTLPELMASAHAAWQAYVDGRHGELLHALPVVLADARRAIRNANEDERAGAHRVLSTAYRLGAGIAGRLELDDLAHRAAVRAVDAARSSDEPEVEQAISLRYLAWALVRQNLLADAERVATRAAAAIEPRMLDRDPVRAGIFGNLLFNAATAAMNAGSSGRADDLLAAANAAAVRSRGDTATEAAIFGPRVAALQRVDFAVRAGDPEQALSLAATVPTAVGNEVPAFWEAGHRLFLAAAALELRREPLALGWLAEARDLAPDWVRHQPLGKRTMGLLVERTTRRRGVKFAELAAHYGVGAARGKSQI
ncbi:helix-turn-helix transcriptional regulator [Amycolatopsis sp. PS_44_ISF1]|uniref:helix-turn-helix domain-containing protein n=1 Tax=Amycolatopsis sp. PS_44_ISF1 TaxID=2974917 RepID=UPI0028DDB095|nr:helix-turn-helix transcriptional regulator [Amycolatopsis sp. PS_44_ISF1]MDT8913540.1 helix-turn-helix transcriptional regulator [Amycolatopsis sp. PS_44_ISF1]